MLRVFARVPGYVPTFAKEYTPNCTTPRAQSNKQPGPVAYSIRGQACHALPPNNHPSLSCLTVAFEVIPCNSRWEDLYYLVLRSSSDVLPVRTWSDNSICVLLDSMHSISPDTSLLSLVLEHEPTLLSTLISSACRSCQAHGIGSDATQLSTTRIVRVVPSPVGDMRPRAPVLSLPTELLLEIFEAIDSCKWQFDLLSFAQVCRQWSCAIKVFFDRWESSAWKNHCPYYQPQFPSPFALASALSKTPVLGLGVQRLRLSQHDLSTDCCHYKVKSTSPGFTTAAMTILRATKNLRCLHLSQDYTPKSTAFFAALPELHDLRTLSITRITCRHSQLSSMYCNHSVSTSQLARCMARWPALASLTVEHLEPGRIGMMDRLFLQPPACALSELCIRQTSVCIEDLFFLTASSTHTLTKVTLEWVSNLPFDGLVAFLGALSQTLTSLTMFDGIVCRENKHALDHVVPRLRRLETLNIRGRVASEDMLRRRSEVFERSRRADGSADVPVVRLSCRGVPLITPWKGDAEWPGWQMVACHAY